MRVIIHGGMQKAGSSAVQEYLTNCRDALKAQGVLYPDFGHREHWLVTAAFVAQPEGYHHMRRRYRGNDVAGTVAGVREELARLVREGDGADTLLISHEDLSVRRTIRQMEGFFTEAAGQKVDVTFLAYVRHPVPMYPSVIQQALKSYRDRGFLPSSWLSPHLKRVAGFRQPVPARVILRPFAPPTVPDWDVIEDFRELCASVIGRPLPDPAPQAGINTSMSWEACAVLELARAISSPAELKGLPGIVRVFDSQRRRTKLRLPDGWAEDIAATNAKDWNAVLPLLDCSKEVRDALKIEPHPRARDYVDQDVRRWLVSGLDEDFCRELGAACDSDERPRLHQPAIHDWLEREVIGRTAAIKAST